MTLIEKILQNSAGKKVRCTPDLCMINDGQGHACIEHLDVTKDFIFRDKVIVILDHSIPAGSFSAAAIQKKLIGFAERYGLRFIQSAGIGYHVLLETYVNPGEIIVSSGTHNSIFAARGALGLHLSVSDIATLLMEGSFEMTVPETVHLRLHRKLQKGVYAIDLVLNMIAEIGQNGFAGKVVELSGDGLTTLSHHDRIVICGMMSQTGALSVLINEKDTEDHAFQRAFDLALIQPTATIPDNLHSCKPIGELQDIAIHAGFIGGCNGGRIEDLRIAANILQGRKVKRGIRLLIGPATNSVYLQAIQEGLVEIFLDSGAQVTNPGCASCKTDSIGVVGDDEILVSTGSYNFPGCCGSTGSKVYLASSASVTQAAVAGHLAG